MTGAGTKPVTYCSRSSDREKLVIALSTRRPAAVAGAVLATLLLMSGCTGGSSKTASGIASSVASGGSEQGAKNDVAAPAVGPASGQPKASTPLQQKDFVRTASLDVEVADVDQAADAVLGRAARVSAQVSADQRTSDGDKRHATLVLRVPPAALDGLIADTGKLGRELDRTVKGDDVTSAHADINARVQALTISVGRLRDFLRKSGSINDLVSLENQLSQRESELASTIAQQRALESQIAQSTLTIQLKGKAPAAVLAHQGPSGFATAVGGGWHGVTVAFRWLAAGLGYALPFLALAAMVLIPLGIVQRRRRLSDQAVVGVEPGDPSATAAI
ncbi:MAG: hypothetical protein QOE71_3529 [Pseudonocardiales bacterium]|nr:hypothetical protein [Pseudonocardiales bacterium]